MNNLLILYDIISFDCLTLENEPQQKKNQVILFGLKEMKHSPIVSFCYEDVCSVTQEKAMEKVEIYIHDTRVERDGTNIIIKLGTGTDNISLTLAKIDSGAKVDDNTFTLTNSSGLNIMKTLFNNYEYIEKTIIDQVHEHEDEIQQLITQVKKLTSNLRKLTYDKVDFIPENV